MEHFVSLTTETIVELISHAKYQVVYKAPGMEHDTAYEIVRFAKRTGKEQVAVTLDLSVDVYRDGYGDKQALDTLSEEGIQVKHMPGLRIGFLVIDDKEWVFSPMSKLTPRNGNSEQKNAILAEKQDRFLMGEEAASFEDGRVDPFGDKADNLLKHSAGQEEAVSIERMEQVRKELSAQPERNFSSQRLLSEYRSLIQFVEITFKGARLAQTTMKIPSELVNVTKKKGFEDKMKATYQLFHEDFLEITKPLKDEVNSLREKYTRALSKKYGRVILVKHKGPFEKAYGDIMNKIEQYKIDLHKQITKQIQRTKQELIDYFTPVVMDNPPEHLLQGTQVLEEQEVKSYIDWLLGREIPTCDQILKRIECYYLFKDITEEILQDPNFYRELEKAYRDETVNWPHQKQNQVEFSLY